MPNLRTSPFRSSPRSKPLLMISTSLYIYRTPSPAAPRNSESCGDESHQHAGSCAVWNGSDVTNGNASFIDVYRRVSKRAGQLDCLHIDQEIGVDMYRPAVNWAWCEVNPTIAVSNSAFSLLHSPWL